MTFTYSALLSKFDQELKEQVTQEYTVINLNSISRRDNFKELVAEFFQNSNESKLLIIHADMISDTKNRINMCRSIINSNRVKRLKTEDGSVA